MKKLVFSLNNAKRFLSLFLVIVLIFGVLTPVSLLAANPEDLVIAVINQEASSGQIINVPISITQNPAPGVAAISALRIDLGQGLSLAFPNGLAGYAAQSATWPFTVRTGTHGYGMLPWSGRPTGAQISYNHLIVGFTDVQDLFNSTETGALITLRVRVADDATGVIPITLSGGDAATIVGDVLSTPRPSVLHNGHAEVLEFLWGDVNGDNEVNLFDAVSLILWVNAGSIPGAINETAARITSATGRPDLFDAVALILWINAGGDGSIGHPGPPT